MNTQTLPSVGSVVSITTKHQNIYIHTYKEKPFEYHTITGKVLPNDKWLEAHYISIKTDNKNYPISMISINNIEKIEIIEGSQNFIQKFPVDGSKGKRYIVSFNKQHYSCTCPGFTYNMKCKHIDLVRNDYYE